MRDLIDRHEAIYEMSHYIFNVCKAYGDILPMDKCRTAAASVLGDLPSMQSEIIRCSDCKYHEGRSYCSNADVYGYGLDDFCSLAERKTDE